MPSPEPVDPQGLHRNARATGEHNRRLLEDGVAAEDSPYCYAHQDLRLHQGGISKTQGTLCLALQESRGDCLELIFGTSGLVSCMLLFGFSVLVGSEAR